MSKKYRNLCSFDGSLLYTCVLSETQYTSSHIDMSEKLFEVVITNCSREREGLPIIKKNDRYRIECENFFPEDTSNPKQSDRPIVDCFASGEIFNCLNNDCIFFKSGKSKQGYRLSFKKILDAKMGK